MHSRLLVVFLFLGCLENQSDLEKRCTPVLQEILDIQAMRDTLREDFKKITQRYREKKVDKIFWNKQKNSWYEKENRLAGRVNDLYVYSYDTGCLK
tara:strand:+ start:49 stop:336 length:288 start_codon:yes stop_codon:yes gene_type:complete